VQLTVVEGKLTTEERGVLADALLFVNCFLAEAEWVEK
jgi:hypothetical protein